MAKHLVTRSWPITQGLPLALHKLTEGTVPTDLLVAYTSFFLFFLDPIIGAEGVGPKAQTGATGLLTGDLLVRGAMLALPITSSGEWRTHSSE